MKVISAGFSKTGTTSLNVALTELGYGVYDYADHFWYHGEEWKKILTIGGSVDDFRRMYKDVDVVVDAPAYTFWEEIHRAFPEAKIILTTRDEESWLRSIRTQYNKNSFGFIMCLASSLTPTGWKMTNDLIMVSRTCLGIAFTSFWRQAVINELVTKQIFRRHNAYVMQKAPKDKLLVYNVKEGWKPLCEFLGKDVPDKPFPHMNVAGTKLDELLKGHPMIQRLQREFVVPISILFGVGLFGIYKFYKNPPWFLCGKVFPTS